ncbi:MAG: polysaccharide deacetylase family protein [Ruminiclostridium sp.]|nr:polysaccharide deacetylase family protein [Ruminiclostridium sp.]
MKLKILILCCALLAAMFTLAGCADRKNEPGTSTTTTPEMTGNGAYDADERGIVDDDNTITEKMPDTTGSGSSTDTFGTEEPGDVTDNGVVTGTSDTTGAITSDEAAFASSYMSASALSESSIGWGLGKERDSDGRPLDAVNAEKKYAALGARFLTSGEKRICLTFDEGYENGFTAGILDTLRDKGVKAVFFVTGDYCKSAPELVRRMIDEGHTVGNHTWSHPSLPHCTQKEVWADITRLHDYVKSEFGYEMKLFRFPMGEFSERTLDDVHELGYTSLFWSFAYADWDPNANTDPAEALAKIEASTHSGIYLLHAVSKTNADLLGSLLDYWHENGYTVGAEL